MSVSSGSLSTSTLVEILRSLVNTKQTGYLKIKENEREGFIAVENGVIVNAKTGPYTALHALFQFVGWRETKIEFHERPMADELGHDLAVYEPQVLLDGLMAKVEELTALREAIPSFDSVLHYVGRGAPTTLEVTPEDLNLLNLADGRRTVRDIADQAQLTPAEVVRTLARFRFAGILELVGAPKIAVKSAMAAAG